MPLFGAHMSISGGYYKAVDAAAELGMDTVQLFTKNNNQWQGKTISPEDERLFRDALAKQRIEQPLSHSSYLINLASADAALWAKSVDAMVVELQRAAQLGIRYVVVHPGASVSVSEEEGLANVVRAIDEVHRRVPAGSADILLENTAGQGTCLGWKFAQLGAILDGVQDSQRLGVCFDTCHALAAGYALADAKDYKATWSEFDECVGVERLRAFHVNDSQKPLGSRVDRHDIIGEGLIGLDAFGRLLRDERFAKIPGYLETPPLPNGDDSFGLCLTRLRSLLNGAAAAGTEPAQPTQPASAPAKKGRAAAKTVKAAQK